MISVANLFLGWDQPWLQQLAQWLLSERHDFSDTIIIVPGKRAGRRLLELLALMAKERSLLMIPPRMVTLEGATSLLLQLPALKPEAGAFLSRLAWRQAAAALDQEEIQKIQHWPKGLTSSEREAARHRVAALAEKLAAELGREGLTIADVAVRIGGLTPESADREEPRWNALAQVQQHYRALLETWGFCDKLEALHQRLLHGTVDASQRVLAVGIIDYGTLFDYFFKKVNPQVIVIAPESHAAGFSEYGKFIPSYWLGHPAVVEDDAIVPCERSADQAKHVLRIISSWKQALQQSSVSSSELMTIVAPDQDAIPLLRETAAMAAVKTRWAGGRFFRGGTLDALLHAIKEYLDRRPYQAPSIKAVAMLLRHPLIASTLEHSLSTPCEKLLQYLDHWEREHLPRFLEQEHLILFKKQQPLVELLEKLEEMIPLALEEKPLDDLLQQLRGLLMHLFEKEMVSSSEPEGHYFLGCLEKFLSLIEEAEEFASKNSLSLRAADAIALLLEILSKETIPELEQSDAVEILGWLEASADDTPFLLLTSLHEGAVPEFQKNDPLVSEGLRKALGLAQQEDRLARDHYLLHVILASRKKEGAVVVIAPRHNGRGEPVRPSRLLLQGCSEEILPARVLALTQRKKEQAGSTSSQEKRNSLFQARPVVPVPLDRLNVTALRTYLKSPRLFYLQHVLKLQEVLETPLEMNARQFGTLLHLILGSLGMDSSMQDVTKVSTLKNWLHQKLESIMRRQFGEHPQSAVGSQKEELVRALNGFATAEAAHRREGWILVASENLLEEQFVISDGRSLLVQGRIDRVDWHPEKKRWLVIDYKTSHRQEWKKQTPNNEHYQKKGESVIWSDLQLPLYLKLLPHLEAIKQSGLPVPTIDNTDLCYFQLPLHPEYAGLSEPLEPAMIEPAWQEAERIITQILDGNFQEIGNVTPEQSPTFAALCGLAGLWTNRRLEEAETEN